MGSPSIISSTASQVGVDPEPPSNQPSANEPVDSNQSGLLPRTSAGSSSLPPRSPFDFSAMVATAFNFETSLDLALGPPSGSSAPAGTTLNANAEPNDSTAPGPVKDQASSMNSPLAASMASTHSESLNIDFDNLGTALTHAFDGNGAPNLDIDFAPALPPPVANPAPGAAADPELALARHLRGSAQRVGPAIAAILTELNIKPLLLLDQHRVPPGRVNDILQALQAAMQIDPVGSAPSQGAQLAAFVMVIGHLPKDPFSPRDSDQMLGIALARGLVQAMDAPLEADLAMAKMADLLMSPGIGRIPHRKMFLSELDGAAVAVMLTQEAAGQNPIFSIPGALTSVGKAVRSTMKPDKPINKAINLLVEALDKWVRPGQLDPDLGAKLNEALAFLPASKHRDKLQDVVNAKRRTGAAAAAP